MRTVAHDQVAGGISPLAITHRVGKINCEGKKSSMATNRKVWAFSPHSGGSKITSDLQVETRSRIEKYAAQNYPGLYTRIVVRFSGALCYIDAFTEPARPTPALLKTLGESLEDYLSRLREVPTHLCRLRYFAGHKHWSMALYSYANERFEPCILPSGEYFGTPEVCFALGASFYLSDEAASQENPSK
jgi:hypothetical protein